MTAVERFQALVGRMPQIDDDFDEDGNVTDEAVSRAVDWAWEQLSEAEHKEFERQVRHEEATRIFNEQVGKHVAERKAETFTNEASEECYRMSPGSETNNQ
jgi:hypothetical protein